MRKSKRLLRLRQFATALAIAGFTRCRDSFSECLADIWHLHVLFKPKPKANKLWRQRVRACHACEIYNPARKTCGPASLPGLKVLGCFCYIPVKALYPDSVCWLQEQGLPSRWPQSTVEAPTIGPWRRARGRILDWLYSLPFHDRALIRCRRCNRTQVVHIGTNEYFQLLNGAEWTWKAENRLRPGRMGTQYVCRQCLADERRPRTSTNPNRKAVEEIPIPDSYRNFQGQNLKPLFKPDGSVNV